MYQNFFSAVMKKHTICKWMVIGLFFKHSIWLQATDFRENTRDFLLEEVGKSWRRPSVIESPSLPEEKRQRVQEQLKDIRIPRICLQDVSLAQAVELLSELSVEMDPRGKGVNILLINSNECTERVRIVLRDLSLEKILDFITKSVNYQFDVENEAVVIRKGREGVPLETHFYPLSRAAVIRLTGKGMSDNLLSEEERLKRFFERAGVHFDPGIGSTLAFDGTQLIIAQTSRNHERLRTILERYNETRQIEIEAKFVEVRQGTLEELGLDWLLQARSQSSMDFESGEEPVCDTVFKAKGRSLREAFGASESSANIVINGKTIAQNGAPLIPNAIDLGQGASALFSTVGFLSNAQLKWVLHALSRHQGSDLLSSPRLTVLSGKTAQITVGQQLRYPESFGRISSEVGTASYSGGGGSAGVTITAGTPQHFAMRNVGVEMEVTPTVEYNGNINLCLEPIVTELEGFIEYGGPSVAISGGSSYSVPSGFFQPIFSVRTVRTEVTLCDGATVVIGGLTREEVKTVEDKVPILGSIPIFGKLFRSKGETSQKRNLLIFVTANLVGPGGAHISED